MLMFTCPSARARKANRITRLNQARCANRLVTGWVAGHLSASCVAVYSPREVKSNEPLPAATCAHCGVHNDVRGFVARELRYAQSHCERCAVSRRGIRLDFGLER